MADGNHRAVPGLGLVAFHDLGADDWGPHYNTNMLLLSAVVRGWVKSRTTVLPSPPAAGETVYIVKSDDATNPNKIAVWDGAPPGSEAWTYFSPLKGMRFKVDDEAGGWIEFDGVAWVDFATGGGGLADAPADDSFYARRNEAWEAFVPGEGGGGGSAGREIIQTITPDGSQSSYTVDVTGYADVQVGLANVVLSAAQELQLELSSDGGTTPLNLERRGFRDGSAADVGTFTYAGLVNRATVYAAVELRNVGIDAPTEVGPVAVYLGATMYLFQWIQQTVAVANAIKLKTASGATLNSGTIVVTGTPVSGGGSSSGGSSTLQSAVFEHHTTGTTSAGAATTDAWTPRPLTREQSNGITGASLDTGANTFTLPAGTYLLDAWQTMFRSANAYARFYDVTNSAVLIWGQTTAPDNETASPSISVHARGVVTLAAETTIRLEYYADQSAGGNDLGLLGLAGMENVHASIEVLKLDGLGGGGSSGIPSEAIFEAHTASGVHGGSAVATTWTSRVLTREHHNDIAGASLSGGDIVLPAGTYEVSAEQVMYRVDSFGVRIRDVTNNVNLGVGTGYAANADNGSQFARVLSRFTLAAQATIAFQYYVANPGGSSINLGVSAPAGAGIDNIFARVKIVKVG